MLCYSFFQASVISATLLLAASSLASPIPDHHAPHHSAPHQAHPAGYGHPEPKGYKEEPVPAHYAFEYGVQDEYSGTNFNQNEKRDGYATSGSYTVQLPDGRTQGRYSTRTYQIILF